MFVCLCMSEKICIHTHRFNYFLLKISEAIIILPWVSDDTSGTHSDKVLVGPFSNIFWALFSRGRSTAHDLMAEGKGATTRQRPYSCCPDWWGLKWRGGFADWGTACCFLRAHLRWWSLFLHNSCTMHIAQIRYARCHAKYGAFVFTLNPINC